MAKIEINHTATEHATAYSEMIEARVWGLAGSDEQPFYIGSGLNFQASGNLWVEILYTVAGAQIFYTRSFLHQDRRRSGGDTTWEEYLNEIVARGEGRIGFGDMLPETSLELVAEKLTYHDENDEEKQSTRWKLKLAADTGAVFGMSGPGSRFISIEINIYEVEEGLRFIRELNREINAVQEGKHPDPASYPDGSSEWPLLWQLNQRAYDQISLDYQENYFASPLLAEAFAGWLDQLPAGGQVLDAGCGHGNPVITRLLEKGFQVSGSDFSAAMLERARQAFPQVSFRHLATTMLRDQAAFDGVCSFNSLLYLDPIDLLNSLYRLHQALKPGGLLFLFGYDSGPDWRGEPFSYRLGQWMWSWHYGMAEAAALLEEHGYFRVLETRKVWWDAEDAERVAAELEKQKQEEEEYYRKQAEEPPNFPMPFFKLPIERKPYAYVVVARRKE